MAYFLAGGLLVLAGFGSWAWQQTMHQSREVLRIEAHLAANSARAIFHGLAEDMPYLASQLHQGGVGSLPRAYALLKAYQGHHPAVASIVLFSPKAEMLLNTARPCCSASLPETRNHPEVYQSILNTHDVPLWIGRTQKGLVLGQWRIPVRYVIRGSNGREESILQVSVLLNHVVEHWMRDPVLPETALGLMRVDGLHIARLPAPDPKRLYSTPMSGPLMATLRDHPAARTGTFSGVMDSDGVRRLGAYVFLPGFPIVAYASVPLRLVVMQWWKSVSPFFGLGLLSLLGFVVLVRAQVVREQRHVKELDERARQNLLTGLPNRLAFVEWLDERLAQRPLSLVVLRLDLDDFHDINTVLGPEVGDKVLLETARRVQSIGQAAGGFVAHASGDEFDIALPGATLIDANGFAQALMNGIGAPLEINDRILRLQGGIGIGSYPQDAEDSAGLLRVVDSALHTAKRAGKASIALYHSTFGDLSDARVSFQHAVERALAENEFLLHFQPIVQMRDGKIAGVEALIRWNDPERGMVPPEAFIPLAESTGRIAAIGDWVLRSSCRRLAAWRHDGLDVQVSINLSATQFNSSDLIAKLRRQLDVFGVPAERVELEVTETAVMHDVERSLSVLSGLHALGIGLAIDDFGTGYSSLAYLRRLPAQVIKIDQSFVRDLDSDPEDLAIVRAIVALAKALGKTTVAEGVESAEQWRLLKSLGVDHGQGYWLSPPLPESELRHLLKTYEGYLPKLRREADIEW